MGFPCCPTSLKWNMEKQEIIADKNLSISQEAGAVRYTELGALCLIMTLNRFSTHESFIFVLVPLASSSGIILTSPQLTMDYINQHPSYLTGCIFDLLLRTRRGARLQPPEGQPILGRSVGQCGVNPCALVQCQNGGTCLNSTSSV